jgi:hypothetical protein
MAYIYNTASLGGEPNAPDGTDVAMFLRKHQKYITGPFDLVSYQLGTQLLSEKEAHINEISCGGLFTGSRLDNALQYSEEWHVITPEWLLHDTILMQQIEKQARYVLPAPHTFAGNGETNDEESLYSLCDSYKALLRTMRDAGVYSHILNASCADEVVFEKLAKRRVFIFLSPDAGRSDIECLLEYQHRIALYDCSLLESLFDQYTLSSIILIDPSAEDLSLALELLDEERITIGGYRILEKTGTADVETYFNAQSETEYWSNIVKKAGGIF